MYVWMISFFESAPSALPQHTRLNPSITRNRLNAPPASATVDTGFHALQAQGAELALQIRLRALPHSMTRRPHQLPRLESRCATAAMRPASWMLGGALISGAAPASTSRADCCSFVVHGTFREAGRGAPSKRRTRSDPSARSGVGNPGGVGGHGQGEKVAFRTQI